MKFGNRKITRGMALGAALALFAGVVTLFAVPNIVGTIFDGKFELGPLVDGTSESGITNIRNDNNTTTGPDWAILTSGGGSNTADGLFDSSGFVDALGTRSGDIFGGSAAFVKDDPSAGGLVDLNVYSGGPGDKNSDVVTDWTWTSSSVPAKDDITNAYAYTKLVTASDGTSHKILLVGVEREEASGDSHVDVEFFQAPVAVTGADAEGNCLLKQCGFSGSNTPNDLLVNMDFTTGGTLGSLSVRRRNDNVKDHYAVQDTLTGEGCNASLDICGFNNGGPIQNGGWQSFDNHANIITTLGTNTFTEFGLDVTALGFGNPCFAVIEVKTRSSQSFTATLKDFALQKFQNCFASVATEIHDGLPQGATHPGPDIEIGADCPPGSDVNCGRGSINVGDTIHDKAIVTGQTGFATPGGSVTFKRFTTADCTGSFTSETVTLSTILPATPTTAGKAAAESSSFTATAGGNVSYQATYGGDSNYTSPTRPSGCERLVINLLPSKITTDILNVNGLGSVLNQHVQNNTTVLDEATVFGLDAGGNVRTSGPDPEGTVTFSLFSTADCSGTAFATQTVTIDLNNTTLNAPNASRSRVRSSNQLLNNPAGSFLCYTANYSPSLTQNIYSAPLQGSRAEPLCAFTSVNP